MKGSSLVQYLSWLATLAWVLSKVPVFQRAYAAHKQKLLDDAWLRAQCNQPAFFARMRQHTDVCDRVQDAFNRPPILVGLQACFPEEIGELFPIIGWRALAVMALFVVVVSPTLLVPIWKARSDRRQIEKLQTSLPTIDTGGGFCDASLACRRGWGGCDA